MDWDTLTAAQKRTYREAVAQSHHRRVTVAIQRLNGQVVHTFTDRVTGGQWDADQESTPVDNTNVDLFDPDWVLDWKNGAHRRFRAQITDARFIPALNDWVEVHVFTGPLWDFNRKGPAVSLTARGIEQLVMGSVRSTYSKPAKTKATQVINDLFGLAGVPKGQRTVPNLNTKLPDAVTVRIKVQYDPDGKKSTSKLGPSAGGSVRLSQYRKITLTREDTYLDSIKQVAGAIGRQVHTTGDGRFVVRKAASKPVLTIGDSLLLEPVETKRVANDDLKNVFVVLGKDPKGRKKQVRAEARFPQSHPLSAESLAPWGGSKPYELIEITENDKIATHARALSIAKGRRDRAMREVVEYGVVMAPVAPWLRPGDVVTVVSDGGTVAVRCRQMSLPLAPGGGGQSLGTLRRAGGGKSSGTGGKGGGRRRLPGSGAVPGVQSGGGWIRRGRG